LGRIACKTGVTDSGEWISKIFFPVLQVQMSSIQQVNFRRLQIHLGYLCARMVKIFHYVWQRSPGLSQGTASTLEPAMLQRASTLMSILSPSSIAVKPALWPTLSIWRWTPPTPMAWPSCQYRAPFTTWRQNSKMLLMMGGARLKLTSLISPKVRSKLNARTAISEGAYCTARAVTSRGD
jgi:hypothetical protein